MIQLCLGWKKVGNNLLEYIGKYASCQVMIDQIEEEAITQIYSFLNCPAFEGAKIRIQPDVHAGAGAVIGFTCTMTDKIIPNVVGVDIGCGVVAYKIGKEQPDFGELDTYIRKHIPSGFSVHNTLNREIDKTADEYRAVAKETDQDENRVVRSIGSLGGGNHFIEIDKDNLGNLWLVIHSGARNFGLKIALFHQARAVKTVGRGRGLEWLEGNDAEYYLYHMSVAQKYAAENRTVMAKRILEFFNLNIKKVEMVESVHNYIDLKNRMIRKGAIAAYLDDRVIIPWNMRDGLIIGRGKGNQDWNYSAPHGAGRIMGRGKAKKTLSLDEYKETMVNVWSSCISQETLDEAPMVYKDHEMIKEAIQDTVDIELTLKPLYNFKAGKENE